ncbi:MAG: PAS domain-containing protein [Proteobacteria bacterium]|nr:PAS domain-containing protein [Pseudomonadota bacterium]
MKMRTQILFAQLPTAIIICLITTFFILITSLIKEKADVILTQNFKSIIAMQKIDRYLEDLNNLYASQAQVTPELASKTNFLENMIERHLVSQEENIKETGEKEETRVLQTQWEEYKKTIHSPLSPSPSNKLYNEIKATTDTITRLNQDGLIRTKENLSTFISNFLFFITFGSIVSLVFGFSMSWFFTGLFLNPLNAMAEIMSQAGREEKTIFLNIKGSEEIEKLTNEFNLMTSRLQDYHEDSLKKVIKEYQILKAAVDALPEPILLLDSISNFIYINKPARHLLKVSSDLKKMPSLFHVEDTWKEILLRVLNTVMMEKEPYHPTKNEDTLSIDKEGKKTLFLPWGYPIKKDAKNGGNAVEAVAIILQDLMRKPLTTVSNADIYEKLAHEFQSLLIEIHMALHLCIEETVGPLTLKQHELLFAARDKCNHMEKLCQALLSLSKADKKIQPLLEEEVDLNTIVQKQISSLQFEADQKGVFFHFEEPPYLSKIKANPDEIKTVVSNLLHNALHYAHVGTIIKINLTEKNKFIEFSVNNKGPSIPPDYRQNIFKKHFKVPGQPEERAGLGLYIAKKITTAMGGKIGYRCSDKGGTTFWVKFSIAPPLTS